jgi:hypothetical protein
MGCWLSSLVHPRYSFHAFQHSREAKAKVQAPAATATFSIPAGALGTNLYVSDYGRYFSNIRFSSARGWSKEPGSFWYEHPKTYVMQD